MVCVRWDCETDVILVCICQDMMCGFRKSLPSLGFGFCLPKRMWAMLMDISLARMPYVLDGLQLLTRISRHYEGESKSGWGRRKDGWDMRREEEEENIVSLGMIFSQISRQDCLVEEEKCHSEEWGALTWYLLVLVPIPPLRCTFPFSSLLKNEGWATFSMMQLYNSICVVFLAP